MIREITLNDAEAASKLSAELGYPVSTHAMQARIKALHQLTNRAVYVACESDAVVGWIDVGLVYHLQSEASGEIGGLVVSSELRGRGIGHQLVATAEQWVRDRGITSMLVRSRISREAAHRFYYREGYERTKTSAVFMKRLL
jgi:GNAT superfamily N-acetyltransferase